MPERDGYEVAAFIKNDPQLAHIPVLLLTGAFEPIDEVKARAVGCDGVLVKPFEPQMVISRVRDLLAGNRTTELQPEHRAYLTKAPANTRGERIESAPPAADSAPSTSLEDYFDRLDAALASKTVPPPPQYQELTPVPLPANSRTPIPMPGHPPASGVRPSIDLVPPPAPSSSMAPVSAGPVSVEQASASMPPLDLDLDDWDPSAPQQTIEQRAASQAAASAPAIAPPVPASPAAEPPAPPPEPPSLQEAFAALLAAEQSQPIAPPRIDPDSNDLIDEVVRRVIARMGNDSMKTVVLDAAERLVREEIARIKGQ